MQVPRDRRAIAVGGLAVAAVAVLAIQTGAGGGPETLEGYVAANAISLDIPGEYRIASTEERSVSGLQIREMTATEGDRSIVLEVLAGVDPGFAGRYIESERKDIESIYVSAPQPYAGVPTQDIDCPPGLYPNVSRWTAGGVNYTYIELYANAQKEFGVCSRDAVAYEVDIVMGYCTEDRRLYRITGYRPVDGEPGEPLRSFRCG